MSRDDDQAWAELVDSFHASGDAEGDQPWPEAEDIDPDAEDPDAEDADAEDADAVSLDAEDPALDVKDSGLNVKDSGLNVEDSGLDAGDAGRDHGGGRVEDDAADAANDHFVPPTPTPLPRGDAVTRLAWAAVIGGPLCLVVSAALSWRPSDELLLFAVGAFVAGFVTLVARMRERRPDDPDDGAVL